MSNSIEAQLESLADYERAEAECQFSSDPIDQCDLCGKKMTAQRFAIDGEVKGTAQAAVPDGTTMGQWGYMCPSCFSVRGVGIGWGKGELYTRAVTGKWLLVAGFPPSTGVA